MATININLAGIQADIQFKDEGVNQGAAGDVTTVDFVGAGVTAVEAAGTLTVTIPGGAGSGDVVGPASATDNAIARFNLTTGKLIQNSVAIVSDGGFLTGLTGFESHATGGDDAIAVTSVNGEAVHATSTNGTAFLGISTGPGTTADLNNNNIGLALKAVQNGGTAEDIANFFGDAGGLVVENDGGQTYTSATGAATTRTGLSLGNVDNTSDANKPISTATQTALDLKVDENAAIVGATNTKITYDAKGLVTSGTAATTADINDSSNRRYVTDAQLVVVANTSGTNSGDQTNISGNAATVTTNANLTGPVTSTGNATAIADAALSIAKTSGLQAALDAKQAADAELLAIAGLVSAANKAILFTGSGTATLIDLQLGVEAAYTGTPTFTAGAAPSGASNLRQYYTQVGNLVTWQISLTYATTGTTVTNLSLTFPTEFPTPDIPTGFAGADVKLWNCDAARLITTPSGTLSNAGLFMITRNSADTGFEIESTAAFATGSYRSFIISGSYFTA